MVGKNKYWGKYGTNKIDAEVALMKRVPSAYPQTTISIWTIE